MRLAVAPDLFGALTSRQESGWTPLFHSCMSGGEVWIQLFSCEISTALGEQFLNK
jgi:hypothetical protein